MLSVGAPNVPQLRIRRPGLPSTMPPHPCVRVTVDERHVIPDPRPPGHEVKTWCRALGWWPVPGRQDSWWRCPSARGENEARLGGDPPAAPGFGCRRGRSAGRCEQCNPARTTTPSHLPMMPLFRCRRCDARRLRPARLPSRSPLTCMLSVQRLPSSRVDRRPRTAWRRPGGLAPGESVLQPRFALAPDAARAGCSGLVTRVPLSIAPTVIMASAVAAAAVPAPA